jgi:hypothetical protein
MLCQSGSLYLGRVAHHILINFLQIYWAGGSLYSTARHPTPIGPLATVHHLTFEAARAGAAPRSMTLGTLVRQTLLSITRPLHLSPMSSGLDYV